MYRYRCISVCCILYHIIYISSITPRFKARVSGTSAVVKKSLTIFLNFFTTAVVPFTHGLNRGVMLHMYKRLERTDIDIAINS